MVTYLRELVHVKTITGNLPHFELKEFGPMFYFYTSLNGTLD